MTCDSIINYEKGNFTTKEGLNSLFSKIGLNTHVKVEISPVCLTTYLRVVKEKGVGDAGKILGGEKAFFILKQAENRLETTGKALLNHKATGPILHSLGNWTAHIGYHCRSFALLSSRSTPAFP